MFFSGAVAQVLGFFYRSCLWLYLKMGTFYPPLRLSEPSLTLDSFKLIVTAGCLWSCCCPRRCCHPPTRVPGWWAPPSWRRSRGSCALCQWRRGGGGRGGAGAADTLGSSWPLFSALGAARAGVVCASLLLQVNFLKTFL